MRAIPRVSLFSRKNNVRCAVFIFFCEKASRRKLVRGPASHHIASPMLHLDHHRRAHVTIDHQLTHHRPPYFFVFERFVSASGLGHGAVGNGLRGLPGGLQRRELQRGAAPGRRKGFLQPALRGLRGGGHGGARIPELAHSTILGTRHGRHHISGNGPHGRQWAPGWQGVIAPGRIRCSHLSTAALSRLHGEMGGVCALLGHCGLRGGI